MKYQTIVADPPWRYSATGERVKGRMAGRGGGAERHYTTMSMDEIAALPVSDLADVRAHLYLWVTNPKMFLARPIVEAWGFKYMTLLTWVKTGAPGLGFYFRGATEHVIFATRGGLGIEASRREPNLFTAPRGRHSAKPQAFYDLVERVSPAPRLELFARSERVGLGRVGKRNRIRCGAGRMTDQGNAATSTDGASPEERLESWRFVVAEAATDNARSAGLLRWMQEVEAQIASLRGGMNNLPDVYARKGIVW